MNHETGRRFRRLAVQALSVAAGVLLAFSVDAWWDRAQERQIVEGLRSAAAVEAETNRELLFAYREAGGQSLAAARDLVLLISPQPEEVALDTVLSLMGRLLLYNAAPIELAATDRLLSSGDLEVLLDPDFHRGLLNLRFTATRYAEDGRRFEQIHEELITTFGEVAPMGVLSGSKPGVHPPSDFPVDVRRVLSSGSLEGAVGNLAIWVDNLNQRVGRLIAQSDSVWGAPN